MLATYSAGVTMTALILFQTTELPIPTHKRLLLGLLALDVAGGVVSNFTQGTSDYYAERRSRRTVFLALHVLQPVLLMWVFPADGLAIAALSGYAIVAAIAVNGLQNGDKQRNFAALLAVLGIGAAFAFSFSHPMLLLLVLLFIIKLIVAFAVRWR